MGTPADVRRPHLSADGGAWFYSFFAGAASLGFCVIVGSTDLPAAAPVVCTFLTARCLAMAAVFVAGAAGGSKKEKKGTL